MGGGVQPSVADDSGLLELYELRGKLVVGRDITPFE